MKICWIVFLLLLLNACASTSSTRDAPLLPIENPNNEIAQENVSNPDATSGSTEPNQIKPPIALSRPDNQITSNDNKIVKSEWPIESGAATYYANHMEGQITAAVSLIILQNLLQPIARYHLEVKCELPIRRINK